MIIDHFGIWVIFQEAFCLIIIEWKYRGQASRAEEENQRRQKHT